MAAISREIKRQVGVIVNRKGAIVAAIVGSDKEIEIPPLATEHIGKRPLRGMRCIHTHLKDEPLTRDDYTDLALLRLDSMTAIGVDDSGEPRHLYSSHLLPFTDGGEPYKVIEPFLFQNLNSRGDEFNNFAAFTDDLEEEILRAQGRGGSREGKRGEKSRGGDKTGEGAILISVDKRSKAEQKERLTELAELAATSEIEVLDSFIQRPDKINPKYVMGIGKLKDVVIRGMQKGATMLIFDSELTPTQTREIGDLTELKVIDRTQLILDIFARRAHSRDGKVQVELAQLRYLLPRLTGKGTAMSRLMGGIGGRGPGETKLEVDRRKVGRRIAHLERELESLSRGRRERRRRRVSEGIPIISIVGYTNAGKSTLLNTITQSKTLSEDKLFATLDTATRRIRFPEERNAVLTDTVGFIRSLPPDLMRAFKSTLEEMEDADLLLHLVDASSPYYDEHIKTVEGILADIGLSEIPRLTVFNKCDLLDGVGGEMSRNLSKRYGGLCISATDKSSLKILLLRLEEELWHKEIKTRGGAAGYSEGAVIKEGEDKESGGGGSTIH